MNTPADFFVSFAKQDIRWARWITGILQRAGHRVVFQEQDMLPGHNVVRQMQIGTAAARTIAVLSPDYLKRPYPMSEWAAAYVKDPIGVERKLIPVMVRRCSPPGLLAPIVRIDLMGLDQDEARHRLLSGVSPRRPEFLVEPPFPGDA
ncbi:MULTISPECIES: toll/interleukin-1 receptor domain-containing protein [Saccharothrix]|uniref:toll/interleukin-1 receptor domain-containing protein n=1 Tax=Saccharothrix TaxID=2071 RepID=UPI0009401F62|nr:toll/interleukin-1 receptor domain-containing protein [Saccharothrix sp. CB00851]OKI26361.1 hypothetical protein A6A25_32255 [Saccharothrix sp. CB00851]